MEGVRLLLWKNIKILSREKLSLTISTIFPLAGMLVFVGLRCAIKQTRFPEPTIYEAFSLQEIPNIVQNVTNTVYYAPSNSLTDSIMQQVLDNSFTGRGLDYKFVAFSREEELVRAYKAQAKNQPTDETSKILAGVVFTKMGPKRVPQEIKYTLKFPASQRTKYALIRDQGSARANWFTSDLWPFQVFGGPRSRESKYGGFPGYFDEGFLYLQYAINEAVMKTLLNSTNITNMKKFQLKLQRFPAPPFSDDKFHYIIELLLAITIVTSFTNNVAELTKLIIHERSSRLKEFMKIMGLPNWQHWLSWFIRSYILLLLTSALMVCILKLEVKNNLSVLTHSNPLVLFLVLSVLSLTVVSFSFLFSTLFNNENMGSSIAAFIWFLSAWSCNVCIYTFFSTFWEKICRCLFTPGASIFYIGSFLNFYENFGEGLQWDNLWRGLVLADDFSVGHCLVASLFSSVVCVIAALYIELAFPGEYGVALPWYFPFTAWFWLGKSEHVEGTIFHQGKATLGAFEPEPKYLEAGVVIKNLSKVYGSKFAVNHLNLNMYKNQVTSLLGPNGAGKTTTMSILTGLIRPTGGTAWVGSYDITREMSTVRASLGFCPQYNILFDNLSVEEHFQFYCQLKGLNAAETFNETERGIHILGLGQKRKTLTKHLSGGMKRKLCVGMALSARSNVVLLDEPTAGMDPEARRSTWDLIQAEKTGRTVILSTHYMEEADLLGDRIAIIADGQLVCCGSSLFLRSRFGDAYNLVIVKKEDACSDDIKRRISQILPGLKFADDFGTEITCTLPYKHINSFANIFEELESSKEDLGIETYAVGSTTMEEIFIRVSNNVVSINNNVDSPAHLTEDPLASYVGFNNKFNNASSESVIQLHSENKERNRGTKLLWQQLRGLVIKKILISMRRASILVLQVILPLFGLVAFYKVAKLFPGASDPMDFVFSLEEMRENMGTVTSLLKCLPDSKVCDVFKSTLQQYQNIEIVENASLPTYLLRLLTEANRRDQSKYLLAFEEKLTNGPEGVTQLIASFNNQPFHVAPVALNLLFNGLLQLYGLTNTIITSNYPFDLIPDADVKTSSNLVVRVFFGCAVNLAIGFLSGGFVIAPLSERVLKFKHLQVISGAKLLLYWLADFLVNMTSIVIFWFGIIIISNILNLKPFLEWETRLAIFVALLFFGWAMINFCMLASTIFSDPTLAFSRILATNMFASVFSVAYAIFYFPELEIERELDIVHNILYYIPSYGFGWAFIHLAKAGEIQKHCSRYDPALICLSDPKNICCGVPGYYSWDEPGIGRYLVRMAGIGTIFLLLLVAVETELISKISRARIISWCRNRKKTEWSSSTLELLDADVLAEKSRINKTPLSTLDITDNLIVKELSKAYDGKLTAVENLSFGVKKGEVFGLVGINGAGKTTTFKMLTGDESITSGDAFINFYSVKDDLEKARSFLGYCPQFDACIEELTVRETLTLFCRLKGVPEARIESLINKTSENLLFRHYLDKQCGTLSGGNKRKLSTAVAMLGDPAIILLDEPTAGMDPLARRHVKNAIRAVRKSGISVLLTSHNMEECETLCSTLAIMVKGQLKCLGSPQHLKSKLCPGYKLVVQLPIPVSFDCGVANKTWTDIQRLFQEFLKSRFSGCVLKDAHCGFLEYLLPKECSSWAEIFSAMEEAKISFKLEGYNVGQVDLEQVFFNFVSSV